MSLNNVLRLPTLLVPGTVAILCVIAGLVGLWFAEVLEDETDQLGEAGTVALSVSELRQSTYQIETFVAEEHLRLQSGVAGAVPISRVFEADATLARVAEVAGALEGHPDVAPGMERFAGELRVAFFRYITSGEAAHLDQLGALASDLGLRAATLERNTSASPETAYGSLIAALDRVRLGVVAVVAVLVPLASGFTLWAGRRYQRALKVATTREGSLLEANRALARRNDQFHGMYQVVTEVTESLSMKYVVETTVREARQLVAADLVVLHVVEGEHLMLAGSASDEGVSTGGLLAEHVELGEGLVGRAAKRGRTLRLQDVSNVHGHGPALPGAQAGIVVPLIVGARVVGTVSCWAKDANAFSADDERVLEMMASQVATAIAAADVYEETDRFAHRDGLTELPNRRQLTEDIKYEFDRAVRRGREMTVAMIDIDHFKRFNDDHGHHAGDVALQRVAKALAEGLRAEDRLYRYGGEEFAIVLDRETGDQAVQIAERLRAAVSELTPLDDQPARVTISVGLASASEQGASFDELIESADEALYEAKEHGRNRVVVYKSESATTRDAA